MKDLERIFKEGKWAWLFLITMGVILASLVSYLYSDGYFNTHTINTIQNQRVKILDIYSNWGNRVLIQTQMGLGNNSNSNGNNILAVEVKLPRTCLVDSKKWMGVELNVEAVTQYRPFNHTEYMEFPGLKKICN